jgi:hypothetical protein
MPPWDAVEVLRVMTEAEGGSAVGLGEGADEGKGEGAVAMAMHWGTFVTDPLEVLRTLGGLEWACRSQGVGFGRGMGEREKGKSLFVAVNHGGSVCL